MRGPLLLAALLLLVAPAAAEDSVTQGGLVVGREAPGTQLRLDGKPLRLAPDGSYVFGVPRLAGPVLTLKATSPDGRSTERQLRVEPRDYQIDRVEGLPETAVSPNAADLARIRSEAQHITAARLTDSDEAGWRQSFAWPVTGRISGIYGSQRVLNGQPRAPHLGVDVAAPRGTPIRAPAAGAVTLIEDQFLTGNTVLIDHGHGVSSVYAHLDTVAVKPGQRLQQGDLIGTLGMTGRATGPNLHWGVHWFATGLDPALLVPPMPTP